MLLLRDFFLDSASVLPMSIVAFSLSMPLRGETPLVDFRGRLVAGSVASGLGAIAAVDAVECVMRVNVETCVGLWSWCFRRGGGASRAFLRCDWPVNVNKPNFLIRKSPIHK